MIYPEIELLPQDDSTNVELREYVHDLILEKKPKVCVEIGTHKGVTALYMAKALRLNGAGHLYTVDPIDCGFPEILDKFPELKPFITYKQIKAVDLDVAGIDFIFVDGFHEYEAVKEEIDYFLPRLNDKARMLFHDCGGDNILVGVNQAIDEACLKARTVDFAGAKSRLYIHKK